MEYIASLSYGKDSVVLPEVCMRHGLPLDRIVHVEIMATDTLPADLPPMMEFKAEADRIIKARYGIEVEHLHAPKSYEQQFYSKYKKSKGKSDWRGEIYGFPIQRGSWCNSMLKTAPLKKIERTGATMYIGIAADEPNRFHNLTEKKRSPLVEFGYTEADCMEMAKKLGLLSPIYTQTARGGCWFCHNQGVNQLRLLRRLYPDRWALMLKWDIDSKRTFHSDGHTVRDFERRFQLEDDGLLSPDDRAFKWDKLDGPLQYRIREMEGSQ